MARRPPARRRPAATKTRTGAARKPSRATPQRGPASERVRSGAKPRQEEAREFQKLVDIMRRLRAPDGCPWDREQTLATLRPFVLEETYEVLQAIDAGDYDALCGEIGDFIFEGVFLAQIAADEGRFTIADSLRAITAKLVRRHPHVFGAAAGVRTPGQVLEQWEQIKAREQAEAGTRKAVLAGLPKALPALLGAHEIGTRAAAVGFDWTRASEVLAKVREELAELEHAMDSEGAARVEEELGDLLFGIANLARKLGIDAESALRKANAKFSARFAAVEAHFETQGRSVHDASTEEMERAWEIVKRGDGTKSGKNTKIRRARRATKQFFSGRPSGPVS